MSGVSDAVSEYLGSFREGLTVEVDLTSTGATRSIICVERKP
jgi:hypothetical protein